MAKVVREYFSYEFFATFQFVSGFFLFFFFFFFFLLIPAIMNSEVPHRDNPICSTKDKSPQILYATSASDERGV